MSKQGMPTPRRRSGMYSGYNEEGIAWVYSRLRYPTVRGWKFCVGFYAREGFGTRREIFSREAAHGNGTFKVFYVETRKSDQVPPAP